jgi:hypothetical protein
MANHFDSGAYAHISSALVRLAARVGLNRVPKNVTPDLRDYLEEQGRRDRGCRVSVRVTIFDALDDANSWISSGTHASTAPPGRALHGDRIGIDNRVYRS